MFNKQLVGTNRVQNYGNSIGGYLFKWGTMDNSGNSWNKETDFHTDWYGHYPLLFNHGMSPVIGLKQLGTIYEVHKIEDGLMISGILNPDCEWYEAIWILKERGSLVWTASPVQHLTKADNGVWIDYPIAEFSLSNSGPEKLPELNNIPK